MSAPDERPETREDGSRSADGARAAAPYVVHVLTLFPEFFASPLDTSIVRRARHAGLLDIGVHDIREHCHDRHRTADDTPYGGGAGMVMKVEPVVATIEAVEAAVGRRLHRVMLTPQGRPLVQATARRLAALDSGLMLLCGRYEGFDDRVRTHFVDEELSIGDYVLTGGEPAALVVLDAVIRLRPGVLGNEASAEEESFSADGLLVEGPHYTRPVEFRGLTVPQVLRSGDHARIAAWRRQQSLLRTLENRPDLFRRAWAVLSEKEQRWVREHAAAEQLAAAIGEGVARAGAARGSEGDLGPGADSP